METKTEQEEFEAGLRIMANEKLLDIMGFYYYLAQKYQDKMDQKETRHCDRLRALCREELLKRLETKADFERSPK